jgi:hypothetical protein
VCEKCFLFNKEYLFGIFVHSMRHEKKNVVDVCMNSIPHQQCCVQE